MSLPKHPRGAVIFARIITDVKRRHSIHPWTSRSLPGPAREELDAKMLDLLLKTQSWSSIMRAYIYHLFEQPRAVNASDPAVLLILRVLQGGSLSPPELVGRVEKFIHLLGQRKCFLTPDSYLGILSAIPPIPSPSILPAALEAIHQAVRHPKQLDRRSISVVQQLFAKLIGNCTSRGEYKEVVRLFSEMRDLSLPVCSATVYGHVLKAVFAGIKPMTLRRASRHCDGGMYQLKLNGEDTISQALQFVRSILKEIRHAEIPVSPRLISILMRGMGDLLQYSSHIPVSSKTIHTILRTLAAIRMSVKVEHQTAMLDFTWAEILLSLREAVRSQHSRSISRPVISKEVAMQTLDSPSLWSYETAIKRVEERAWRTRLGVAKNGRDPFVPWYHGHQISYAAIELHRLAILGRHCLLHNDFHSSLRYFLQMKAILMAFETAAPQFLASYPHSTANRHRPLNPYKHPSSLIDATSRDLRFRIRSTFKGLLVYLVTQQNNHSKEITLREVYELIDLLRHTSAFLSDDLRFFLQMWNMALCTLLDWQVPYDVPLVKAETSGIGVRHALELFNGIIAKPEGSHKGAEFKRDRLSTTERSYFRRELARTRKGDQLVRCAVYWAEENVNIDGVKVEKSLDVLRRFLKTCGLAIEHVIIHSTG